MPAAPYRWFAPDPATRGPSTTQAWLALEQQLTTLAGLRLIILDPLQPLCALDLNVPENAQFVCSRLAALAASTGASVIVFHDFAKREASTPRTGPRSHGAPRSGDGVRFVFALLWNPKEDQAKADLQGVGQALRARPGGDRRRGQGQWPRAICG